jgi:hypothetical protein
MRVSWRELRALGVVDVISIDAEYIPRRGWHVIPVCLCAKSLWTKKVWRMFCHGERHAKRRRPCPFPRDARILYLSYNAPAEWSFYLARGWELPVTIIDLFAEMCLRENGRKDQHGSKFHPSLLYAMRRYGLDAITAAEKHTMRDRILRLETELCSGPREEEAILDYCMSDVLALEKLFPAMLPDMNVAHAIMRGAHTRACAASEFNGIPIMAPVYRNLKAKLPQVRTGLAMAVEAVHKFGVYRLDKKGLVHWSADAFDALVEGLGPSSWPRTTGGKSGRKTHRKTDRVTFKRMAQRFPQLEPLREVRNLLEELGSFLRFDSLSSGIMSGFSKRWSAQSDLEGGGQGDVKLVVRSDGRDGTVCFLKILRQQNDPERRRRMYRGVAAYRTLEHPRIPKLVDSNAEEYEDSTFKLYLVTEYIPGMTLSQFIAKNGVVDAGVFLRQSARPSIRRAPHDKKFIADEWLFV